MTKIRREKKEHHRSAHLREAETMFRTVFDQAPIGIDLVALDGTPIRANRTLQEFIGYTEAEMRRRRFTDWTHPEDIASSLDLLQRMRVGKAHRLAIEKRYVRKNGEVVWGHTTVTGVRGKDDRVEYFITMVEDITERKALEQKLRDSLDLLEGVYSSLEEAVFVIDPEKRTIVSCNRGAEQMFGYRIEEMIGRNTLFLHVNRKTFGEFGKRLAHALQSHGVFQIEFSMRRKDGTVFPTFHVGKEIHDRRGDRTLNVGIIRDLSKQKEAAEVLGRQATLLSDKTKRMQELNVALKVLLDQREREKKTLEENLAEGINGLIMPLLDRIRKTDPNPLQTDLIDILEANLREIIRPYADRVAGNLVRLSPTETKIAGFIRRGVDSKGIAEALNLSSRTVEYHRLSIRKKLGIRSRRVNLESYLAKIL